MSVVVASLLLSACGGGSGVIDLASLPQTSFSPDHLTSDVPAPPAQRSRPGSEGSLAGLVPSAEPRTLAAPAAATPFAGGGALAQARQLRLAGDKAKALAVLDRAAEGGRSDPALERERGLLALELGQLDKAAPLLQAAARSSPQDWRIHSGLGAMLASEGRQQEAQLAFARALELAPDHPSVLNNLALSYALDGKHDQAEQLLRKAAQVRGAKPQARQNLSLLLALNGQQDEARKIAEATLPPGQARANASFLAEVSGARPSPARSPDPGPQRAADSRLPGETPIYRLGGPGN